MRKRGRPTLGTTKKVSITLPDAMWSILEENAELTGSMSATLRNVIMRTVDPKRLLEHEELKDAFRADLT